MPLQTPPFFSSPPTGAADNAEQTLTRWQQDEAAIRARMRPAGIASRDEAIRRSGLELFDAMLAGALPSAPIATTLDFLLVHVEKGFAVFQGRPQQAHYNPLGTVHGGWFATLLDSAVACSIHSALPAGRLYTTVELKINIVKALTDAVPLVRAEGRVIHLGRSMGTAEGRLIGPDGALYAHASTTCFILDAKPSTSAA